ncbi:MAG: peptidase M14 [Candidatus Latescibacteria bacterium]|nr:peptidase M14 [Candidatus Latescibacterota bacterium]NIO28354.1 peptidase M14 [Candidatus Latescibacterota bacterium]NIO55903.1 peptidase M14 [Candidatus Latescibacterota bacterium]NIT01867.1 peptidase M14 [Candidatus Latescibacterota bacterium]
MRPLLTGIFMLFSLIIFGVLPNDAADWRTDYEKSGCKETPRYDATVAYCKRLASASHWIHYTTFGNSPQGRDLPLLMVDKTKHFTPESVRKSDNAVLLIQAGIHSGEIDGKDAGLMLVRDIAITKKYPELLDHLTVLFMPIFNVDGHERFGPYNRINQNGPKEMGWRVTAQNLNLNRDYLKADAPEMHAWMRLFLEWLPDFFVDCHVTDGADYQYVITYGLEIGGSMAPGITDWTRNVYLKNVEKMMEESGFPISPYVIFRTHHEPTSGLISWVAPPRLSEGYTALQNRSGLLIESHMLKDYKTRVEGTYEMLRHTMSILNKEHRELIRLNEEADRLTASAEFREEPFPLGFRGTRDSVMVDFLGLEYEVEKSDLTGGLWHRYSDKPVTYRIPYFNKQEPATTVALPEAYIIPTEWTEVIDRLALHGVEFNLLEQPHTIKVKSYRFNNIDWRTRPYEGRHMVQFEQVQIEEERTYPAGSAVVDMNQRAARVAAHILEPEAPDSYLRWDFFDTIFERKEYTETYVMEAMAREMLASDPDLKEEFEQKVAEDSTFVGNQWAVLNWFYERTPYWDDRKDVYPVGKIFNRDIVNRLRIR